MKLISWNVNGIRACIKKGFLFKGTGLEFRLNGGDQFLIDEFLHLPATLAEDAVDPEIEFRRRLDLEHLPEEGLEGFTGGRHRMNYSSRREVKYKPGFSPFGAALR